MKSESASFKMSAAQTVRVAKNVERFIQQSQTLKKCVKPCPMCPYRKDQENWLDEGRTLFNVSNIHHGFVQSCHMANHGRTHECAGARICLEGGSETVCSPSELGLREPVTEQQCGEIYKKIKARLKVKRK